MRIFKSVLLAIALVTTAGAQATDPLLLDTRLTVHSLVREDIFGGFMSNQMNRFEKGEQNIEILLKERPDQRANLLAWKGGATLYRAVVAHEAGKADEFARLFADARANFAAAAALTSGNDGVMPITGGTLSLFADRLPVEHRAAAWAQAYAAYSYLWKGQGAGVENLPVHMKGELLAGMTLSSQRTGRTDEAARYLDKMLELLPNTPYEATARQWKADPSSAATTNLTCKNCHNSGRLAARVAALGK